MSLKYHLFLDGLHRPISPILVYHAALRGRSYVQRGLPRIYVKMYNATIFAPLTFMHILGWLSSVMVDMFGIVVSVLSMCDANPTFGGVAAL